MKRIIALAAVAALLAACADETSTDVVVDPVTDPDTPVDEVVELTRGDLDAGIVGTDSLTVQITLDGGSEINQIYTSQVDSEGVFRIYELDEGTTGRLFTAIGGTSGDGQISAVVASDGGQFNRFFGGATVNQNSYTAPDGGTTDYVGGYQGLVNYGDETRNGVPGSTSADAVRSFTVEGDVFLKADFTDGVVNGAIFNRKLDPTGDNTDLPELVLIVGDITGEGTFSGNVELDDANDTGVGSYSGAFGGAGATSAGGLIELNPGFLGTAPANEKEFGIFILGPSAGAP